MTPNHCPYIHLAGANKSPLTPFAFRPGSAKISDIGASIGHKSNGNKHHHNMYIMLHATTNKSLHILLSLILISLIDFSNSYMGKKQSRFECWWGEAKDEERKLEIPEYRKREEQSEANLATSKKHDKATY